MTTRRSGLGRGLGALIPGGAEGEADVTLSDGSSFRVVPVGDIVVNQLQPRRHIDEEALRPLASSISELGVLQPILVRKAENGYELIAGERRWRASQLAGLTEVPVIVRNAENVQSLEQALVENLHRKDLNPLDESSAYRQLIDDFGMTHDEVGKRMGKSRAAVSNLLRLLQLPPKVQRLLVEEKLSEGHARALLGTSDEKFQVQLAERAGREGMSVRAVEEAVRSRNELSEPLAKRRPPTFQQNPAALEWQERLSNRLDTRVTVSVNARRGRIVIDFADLEDLDRISQIIASKAQKEAEL